MDPILVFELIERRLLCIVCQARATQVTDNLALGTWATTPAPVNQIKNRAFRLVPRASQRSTFRYYLVKDETRRGADANADDDLGYRWLH